MKDTILSHFANNFEQFFRKYLPEIEKIGGDEWKAICPFHEDMDPSLNFDATTGQWFCHGCGAKGDIFHFFGNLKGLQSGQDFGKILNGIGDDFGISRPSKDKGRITATYDYLDAYGNFVFQVVRFEPGKNGKKKDFRQRRRGKDGKWVWNLKGIDLVLYGLPEVIKSTSIIYVEGEKDVNKVREVGFTATTNPMGAGKWRDHYAQFLKGKQVILIPDNDEPGKKHMAKIATSLLGIAADIKLLCLPGLNEKGDVTDFIESFDDQTEAAERLSIMIDNCPPYIQQTKTAISNDSINILDDLASLQVEKDYTEMLGNEEWFFPNLVIKNQILIIIAKAGGGKTTIIFEFVAPWMIGHHGVEVYYFDCDSPASDHKRMFDRAIDIGPNFRWINPLTHGRGPDDIIKMLEKGVVGKQRFDNAVLIFDTAKKFFNVMDKRSVKPFFSLLRQLVSLGATIIILGHANKYRSVDGNLVFEGVGDIQSDADALIFFEAIHTPDGTDVTTIVDPDRGAKVRGLYEQISFRIERGTRVVTQHKEVVDVPDWTPGGNGKLTDEEIEEMVRDFLLEQTGHTKQADIIEALKVQPGVSYHGIRRVLTACAVHKKEAVQSGQIFYSVGFHNTKSYSVVD